MWKREREKERDGGKRREGGSAGAGVTGQRPVRTAFRAEAGNEAQGHRLCALSALPAALGGTVFSLGSVSGRKYSTWVTLLCSKAKKSPSGKLILFYICNEYIFFPESRPKLVPWF